MSIDTAAIRAAYPGKIIRTHYAGCELSHQLCAIHHLCTEVDRLQASELAKENARLREDIRVFADRLHICSELLGRRAEKREGV